jgi:hypothetical protein
MSAAIAGSDVAITVESMFSMKRATARTSGTIRFKLNFQFSGDEKAGDESRFMGLRCPREFR